MLDAAIEVVVAPKPFEPRVVRLATPPGLTVAEILLAACREGALDPEDLGRTEVDIDGERILEREAIGEIVPRLGAMVNLTVTVHGGSGGGNKALQTVLQVAIMVAAFAVAGPAGTALGNAVGFANGVGSASAFAAGQIVGRIASVAAIELAGGALLQAAFGQKASSATQHYDLQQQTNQSRLREQMPLCLDQRRVSFDLASSAFTSFSGDDMWITAIYAAHYGPCTVDALKIGNTLLSAYDPSEYQLEQFLTPGPRASALYPANIHQDSFQNTLDRQFGNTVTETTVVDAVSLELDFYWAGGLYFQKTDGRTVNSDTKIYIEISPYGANTWSPAPGLPGGTDKDGHAYPAGTFYVQAASKDPVRKTLPLALPSQGHWDVRVHRDTRPTDDAANQDTVTWTALRTPRPGAAIIDQVLSVIVLKVKASQDFSGSLGVVSGVVTPIVPKFNRTTSAWQGDPLVYDATNWGPSTNGAALARYLLTGYPAAKPLAASEIDVSCGVQYGLIEDNGWGGGALITDGSQQDALNKLASAGRFSCYWSGSALVFTPEWIKPAPRQLFAGRNAQGYKRKRIYPDPVHAVYVEFINSAEDWRQDGLFVYAPGYDATNAVLLEKLTLGFSCLPLRATNEGTNYLTRRRLQVWSHEWTAGADSIASSYGDRVRGRRTSSLYGMADARVSHRRWAGGLVSGVRLDSEVRMEAGATYALDVRRTDTMLLGLPLVTQPGVTRDLVFATPLSPSAAPNKGDLTAFGSVNQVTEDVEIIDIDPQADGTCRISAVNYIGPALAAAEAGAIPALTTFLTPLVLAPQPRILSASATSAGAIVGFDIPAQRAALVKGFAVRWRRSPPSGQDGPWTAMAMLPGSAREVRTPALTDAGSTTSTAEVSIDVEIKTYLTKGEPSPAAYALNLGVSRYVPPVTTPSATGVKRTAPDSSTYGAIAVAADAVPAGGIQDLIVEARVHGGFPDAWAVIGPALPASAPVGDMLNVASGQSYDVSLRWRTTDGFVGATRTIVSNVTVPAGSDATTTPPTQALSLTASVSLGPGGGTTNYTTATKTVAAGTVQVSASAQVSSTPPSGSSYRNFSLIPVLNGVEQTAIASSACGVSDSDTAGDAVIGIANLNGRSFTTAAGDLQLVLRFSGGGPPTGGPASISVNLSAVVVPN